LEDAPDFEDSLLRRLAFEAPVARDHVKLNRRHVADGAAKFERVAVPRGTRFSFEIALWESDLDWLFGEGAATAPDEPDPSGAPKVPPRSLDLLALLRQPGFRIGGGARRGYGRIALVAAGWRRLPLATVGSADAEAAAGAGARPE